MEESNEQFARTNGEDHVATALAISILAMPAAVGLALFTQSPLLIRALPISGLLGIVGAAFALSRGTAEDTTRYANWSLVINMVGTALLFCICRMLGSTGSIFLFAIGN